MKLSIEFKNIQPEREQMYMLVFDQFVGMRWAVNKKMQRTSLKCNKTNKYLYKVD